MKTVLAATGSLLLLAGIASAAAGTPTAISSNFNGTNIADSSFIWFNAHLTNVSGGTGQIVIRFRNQFVSLVVPSTGHSFELAIPDAEVVIDPAVNPVSTVFDSVTNRWMTSVQSTGGTPFLSGFAWDVPAGENPRAANPVEWRGEFSANQPGVSISWQWSAAVYTQFSTDYGALGVTAIDGMNGLSQSGTPAEFRSFVIGGARGGGGPTSPVQTPAPAPFRRSISSRTARAISTETGTSTPMTSAISSTATSRARPALWPTSTATAQSIRTTSAMSSTPRSSRRRAREPGSQAAVPRVTSREHWFRSREICRVTGRIVPGTRAKSCF